MSNSLKKRIIIALLVGFILFMIFCVKNKLFDYREDWLIYSLMWSISSSIGYFVSKTIAKATSGKHLIFFEALISFFVALVMLFIIGVILSLSNWDYIVSNTCIPFTVSLFINNIWKED